MIVCIHITTSYQPEVRGANKENMLLAMRNEMNGGFIQLFSDSYSRPSCALLCLIDKIPGPLLDSAMQAMIELSTKNSNDKDEGKFAIYNSMYSVIFSILST